MENISIQSYSAQLRIYSGAAGPPKPKLTDGSDTSPETPSDTSSASSDLRSDDTSRNQDGDSFSMSLEARIVRISMSRTDDGADADSQGGKAGSPSASQPFGSGLVKALMQAVSGLLGKDDAGASAPQMSTATDTVQDEGQAQRRHDHMGNPEEVASNVLQHLQQEYSQKGGSLQAFVDGIQKRMENRKEAAGAKTDGSSDFRNQVDSLITSGLSAWAQTGGQSINVQA